MKFLADVNIPLPLIWFLRQNGHEVQDSTIEFPRNTDIQLIKTAQQNNQIILTRDKDFLELANYPKYKVPLILVSLTDQKTNNIISHFKALLESQSEEFLRQSVTIIKEESIDLFTID